MSFKNIGRKKSIKCSEIIGFIKKYDFNCSYSLSSFRHYDYSMNRIYVKDNNSLKAIGYYCKRCGKIISDIELEKFNKEKQ